MQMRPICLNSHHLQAAVSQKASHITHGLSSFSHGLTCFSTRKTSTSTTLSSSYSLSSSSSSQPYRPNYSKADSTALSGGNNNLDDDGYESDDSGDLAIDRAEDDDGGVEIEIEKTGKNSRRIRSRVAIDASLQTIWNILTDYERLPDFIPGLAVSQLIEKRDNFARLFQIGQQKLAFGINFNAKGIIECYEKEIENFPSGQRRDIGFKMIEGDFRLFEGKWSIKQYNVQRHGDGDSLLDHQFHTTLSYVVDVEPKLWLPVRLVEGILGREIKKNLSSVQAEAQKDKTWDS